MSLLPLLAALPAIYWAQPASTAPSLRAAGIEQVYVSPEAVDGWQDAGVAVRPLGEKDRSARVGIRAPGIAPRAGVASATNRPWIDANGWRFLRAPDGRFWCEAPAGRAAIAAAEAFAYGVDEVLAIDPADVEDVGRMLAFLSSVPEARLPGAADIAVVDDGSPLVGEVLNLMARRNLLFEPVRKPRDGMPLTVKVGSKEFPRKEAQNPEAFARTVRQKLTDERRSLRLFGSEVVIGRLTRDASRARLHLLNYGGRPIEGLRIRLLGSWTPAEARVFGHGSLALEDVLAEEGALEFSLPVIGSYAVIDLAAAD